MAWICVSVFALCVLYAGCFGKPAILKESVKLSADVRCTAEEFTLIHRLKDDSPRTVAKLINGVWMPGERYRERVEHSSTVSLWLTRVNYNDNGHYEFTCAGHVVTIMELEVLIISNNNLSVTEGDTVTLPCYFQTAGDSVDSAAWERNGELVFTRSLSPGKVRYGTGFEGRVSVRSDWFLLGDLSLTVERVQLEDHGDFFCFVYKGRRERGSPAAVRVMVSGRSRDQTTSTPVPPTSKVENETTPCETASVISITAFVTLLICAAPVWLVWWLKSRRSGSSSGRGGGKCFTERNPAAAQVNGEGGHSLINCFKASRLNATV